MKIKSPPNYYYDFGYNNFNIDFIFEDDYGDEFFVPITDGLNEGIPIDENGDQMKLIGIRAPLMKKGKLIF